MANLVRHADDFAASEGLALRSLLFGRFLEALQCRSPVVLAHGAELLGDVAQYENIFRLCYLRGPAGIIVGLANRSADTILSRGVHVALSEGNKLARPSLALVGQLP